MQEDTEFRIFDQECLKLKHFPMPKDNRFLQNHIHLQVCKCHQSVFVLREIKEIPADMSKDFALNYQNILYLFVLSNNLLFQRLHFLFFLSEFQEYCQFHHRQFEPVLMLKKFLNSQFVFLSVVFYIKLQIPSILMHHHSFYSQNFQAQADNFFYFPHFNSFEKINLPIKKTKHY